MEVFHGRVGTDVDIDHAAYRADRLARNGAARRPTGVSDHGRSGSMRQALPRIIGFFDGSSLP
ncbi:hypothetical protein ACFSJS_02650 [Streptomyces desertarenae]|uniref:Uncharacterized protein n=1 Tax=Streptomyces desertarenae TaxID=2666184 RepID=A0ABW4PE47_9ACTN